MAKEQESLAGFEDYLNIDLSYKQEVRISSRFRARGMFVGFHRHYITFYRRRDGEFQKDAFVCGSRTANENPWLVLYPYEDRYEEYPTLDGAIDAYAEKAFKGLPMIKR